MDEAGQPGGAGPGENGNSAGPGRERARINGWAADLWSNAGDALEPAAEPVVPAWSQRVDPSRQAWAPSRYADLLAPQPSRPQPADQTPEPPTARPPASAPPYPYEGDLEDAARAAAGDRPAAPTDRPAPPADRNGYAPERNGFAPERNAFPPERSGFAPERNGFGEPVRPPALAGGTPLRGLPTIGGGSWRDALTAPTPTATPISPPAPPVYNGQPVAPAPTPVVPSAPPAPAARPAQSPLTALAPPAEQPPTPSYELPPGYQPPAPQQPAGEKAQPVYEPPQPVQPRYDYGPPLYDGPTGYQGAGPGGPTPGGAGPYDPPDPTGVLPQRVPSEPDVPTAPEPAVEPPAETPELARIATHLRRDDFPTEPHDRPEGFDVRAVLAAVRGVAGVRDASLRTTPAGAHSLRLDLADGADPAMVSREVARLLQERLGLAAAPQDQQTKPAPSWSGQQRYPEPYAPPRVGRRRAEPEERRPESGPWSDPPYGSAPVTDTPRPGRRRAPSPQRGRAAVEPRGRESASAPVYGGWRATEAYTAEQPVAEAAPPRPLDPGGRPGPRVVIDHVQVSTFGLDATVEVRLAAGSERAVGFASGPAVDAYVLRLCAVAASAALDELLASSQRLDERGRCFVEHAAVVPFGGSEVAVVVVLLVCGGWVEQLAGSAVVAGDPRQAVVRATLAAVNRRLEALL